MCIRDSPGTTGLSATPRRPDHLSRVSGCSSLSTPRGFPCCVRFPCVHAVATTPAQRRTVLPCSSVPSYQPSPVWLPGRPAHRLFRGLLSVHSRYGLHTRAATEFCGPLSEGFNHFVTSIAVSYTHLDVYKRQAAWCACWKTGAHPLPATTCITRAVVSHHRRSNSWSTPCVYKLPIADRHKMAERPE